MALATYNDLVASVADWLHRTDLAATIPNFIQLAEARIYQGSKDPQMPTDPLRVTAMETQASGTAADMIAIPSDLIEIRKINIDAGIQSRALTYAGRDRITELQRTPGFPVAYTIEAGQIVIGPTPGGDYQYSMTYYKRFPALSNTQSQNWLLTNAPNVYLYGTLVESAPYLHDDTRAIVWYRMFVAALNAVQASDDALRSNGGALRMHAA